jgi:hypothetical protein
MKFAYRRYGRAALRPVIPVELLHGRQSIPYWVLVDSGADMSIFDAEIGELAGIDVKAGKQGTLGGVTGASETFYIHTVTLLVEETQVRIPVGFLPNMPRFSYGVVGQKGFFEKFVVKFDLAKEEIELKTRK